AEHAAGALGRVALADHAADALGRVALADHAALLAFGCDARCLRRAPCAAGALLRRSALGDSPVRSAVTCSTGEPRVPYPCVRGHRSRSARGRDSLPDEPSRAGLEADRMKVRYDQRTDTLMMLLRDDVAVGEGDVEQPGVILD